MTSKKPFEEKVVSMLTRFATWLHRKPGEDRYLQDHRVSIAKLVLALSLGGAALGIFAYFSNLRIHEWNNIRPIVKVELKDWKVLYEDGGDCTDPVSKLSCPANPKNPALWESPFSKADSDHATKTRSLKGLAGMWVGLHLRLPFNVDERQFVIGYVVGPYEIYLNGIRVLKTEQTSSSVPQSITLTSEENWVAIHILKIGDAAFPDIFNRSFGGEGVFSQSSLFALTTLESFSFQGKPVAFMISQGLLAVLFLFFWWSAKKKQEYFYLAIFLFTEMFIQVRLYDAVYMFLGQAMDYRIDLSLRILEALFALTLGLSFARVRPNIFKFTVCTGLILATIPFLIWHIQSSKFLEYSQWIAMTWVVPAYAIGALICLAQASVLALENSNVKGQLIIRARRLVLFSLGLTGMAALYFTNSHQIFSSSHYVFWYRFGHLGFVVFLSAIVISEYREQELFVQRAKISKYLKNLRAQESRTIPGALLRVDLKESKLIEGEAASRGIGYGYGTITGEWLSAMTEAVFKMGGEILAESGDEFIAFFDNVAFKDPSRKIETLLLEMIELQKSVEQALGFESGRMQFRAALVTGALRARWKGQIPGYDGDVMSESQRVLDLEKQLCFGRVSTLVIEPALSNILPFGAESYAQDIRTDKEGNQRSLVWLELQKVTVDSQAA